MTTRWAAIALGGLTVLLFHQVLLGGQTFVAPDATAPVGFVRMGEQALYQQHTYPLWNPFVFLGMPSFASGAYNPLIYPPDWPLALIAKVLPIPELTWLILYYFLGAFFLYLLAREWGARPEGALLGGVAFVFAPNLVAVGSHGHGSQLVNSAYIPLLLWLAARWMKRGGWHHLGWLALAGGFQMLRGHAQIAFYTWLAVGLYVLVELIAAVVPRRGPAEATRPAIGLLLTRALGVGLAMGLAFAIAGFYNLPLRDYSRYSIRGGGPGGGVGMDYATAWSLAGRELPTIVVPSAVGFGGPTYWGSMPFTDYPNAYVGMITVVFALIGFLAWNRSRAFALALAAVALMISFGRHLPLYGFLYAHLPLFNKFRVPVMILVLFQLATALGLAWGWSVVVDPAGAKVPPERVKRALLGLGVVLVVALVLGAIGQGGWREGYERAVHAARPDLPPQAAEFAFRAFVGDLMRVSLLGLAALVVGWLAFRRTLPGALASALALALLLLELWPTSASVMAPVIGPHVPRVLDQGRDDVVEFLEKAGPSGSFRIWPIAEIQNNRFAGFGIASIGGYHAAKPRLYQDLVDSMMVPSPNAPTAFNLSWMRLLGIRYVVSPEPLEVPWLRTVYQGSAIVFENSTALRRATVVGQYLVAPTPKAVIDSIGTNRYDGARMTWLDHDPHLTLGGASVESAMAKIVDYRLNRVVVDVTTPAPAILRLADLWYPDWVASVDGKPVEIFKADYLLRAVPVPAGRHRVDFRFESKAVRDGLLLSCAGLLASMALLLLGWWRARRGPVAEAA
jgi:hypothetical protein